MKFDSHIVVQFIEKHWHKKSGLLVALVFIGLSVLAATGTSSPAAGAVLIVSLIGVCGAWFYSNKIPVTKKNHVGFVISIHCEDDEESRRIKEDFIIPLRKLLRSSKRGKIFHFIEFGQHLSSQINDSGDAEKLWAKTRAHFMLYGRVRERVLDGKEHHIIELDGFVSHKPIPEGIQQAFASEFSELLPRRINIPKENDLLSFQFTSEWAGVVAEYIIGFAAQISGDLDYAEELYEDALKKLGKLVQRFPTYARLVERIPVRISEIYEVRAMVAHRAWCRTHDQKYIDELEHHLEKVLDERRNESNILFLSAFQIFMKERDAARALTYLKKMRAAAAGSADSSTVGAWNYNVAFLHAYDGNLVTAIRHYRQAAMAVVQPDIITQIEDFLCWILTQEPNKYQLHYCLGFFNWKTKGDVVQAEKDFDKFLAARREREFENEKDLVAKWVAEMRSRKDKLAN